MHRERHSWSLTSSINNFRFIACEKYENELKKKKTMKSLRMPNGLPANDSKRICVCCSFTLVRTVSDTGRSDKNILAWNVGRNGNVKMRIIKFKQILKYFAERCLSAHGPTSVNRPSTLNLFFRFYCIVYWLNYRGSHITQFLFPWRVYSSRVKW